MNSLVKKTRFTLGIISVIFCLISTQVFASVAPGAAYEDGLDGLIPILDFEPYEEEAPEELFTDHLVKEFERKYRYEFGYTSLNNQYLEMNHFTQVTYAPGVEATVIEDGEKRRKYGEFVLRRMTEFHIDNYAKNSENLRPAYEVKKKLSNYKMEVAKGYRLNIRYSLSGNTVRVNLDNPTNVDTALTYDLESQQQVLEMHYPVDKKTKIGTYYRTSESSLSIKSETRINSRLTGLISGKTFYKNIPTFQPSTTAFDALSSSILEYDNMVMVGLKWRL